MNTNNVNYTTSEMIIWIIIWTMGTKNYCGSKFEYKSIYYTIGCILAIDKKSKKRKSHMLR